MSVRSLPKRGRKPAARSTCSPRIARAVGASARHKSAMQWGLAPASCNWRVGEEFVPCAADGPRLSFAERAEYRIVQMKMIGRAVLLSDPLALPGRTQPRRNDDPVE